MEIICGIKGIVDINSPKQGLMDINRAGFQNIVLDFSIGHKDKDIEIPGKRIADFIEKVHLSSVAFGIAKAPFLPWDTKNKVADEAIRESVISCIKICGRVGCKHLIVQPLFAGIADAELWNANFSFYLSLAEYAGENQVMILLENQCKNVNGHLVRGVCSDAGEVSDWIDALNREAARRYGQGGDYFGFCMNVGTCNLNGQNMSDFAMTLGSRIKAVVLRDCSGVQNDSLLPFSCASRGVSQTDWLNLIRGLRGIGFDGRLVIDFADTAFSFSVMLRPQLMSLAKSTAEYFRWQLEIEQALEKYPVRVLFGAGNMCRNYMKNYGDKYPPKFTCDNNATLWGQQFEGLEIKNPECLKELPEATAIFICNMYYREIEEQLREMGIKNPIEYFSDEYMPSFYFDRLDVEKREHA